MDPIAFHIGTFAVHWYGIMVATAFLVGVWTATRRGLEEGLSPELITDLGVWLMVGGIIGARVFHVVTYWDEDYAGQPWYEIFAIQHGGLVFYGGLLGASIAGVFFIKSRKLPLWKVADTLAPSIALGHIFGRVGCFLNGCCYGKPTDLPWAIHFPADHPTGGVGVHPTELYSASYNLLLYLGLAWLYRRKHFNGQVFGVYLVSYSVLRFLVEFLRGDYNVYYLGGWATAGQVASIVVFGAGVAVLWTRYHCAAKGAPTNNA